MATFNDPSPLSPRLGAFKLLKQQALLRGVRTQALDQP